MRVSSFVCSFVNVRLCLVVCVCVLRVFGCLTGWCVCCVFVNSIFCL